MGILSGLATEFFGTFTTFPGGKKKLSGDDESGRGELLQVDSMFWEGTTIKHKYITLPAACTS